MEKSRKILDVVFRCISKLSDDEIESLINKESKLVCISTKKKGVVAKRVDNELESICESIDKARFREEAYEILKKPTIKKDTLINIAKHLEVHVLKSYTKIKLIERIVETVVGTKVDREAIGEIDIK